ncbi:MAG: hypothetical protein AABZ14_06170 [Candidatus Margulisiibacteriota bacterium]
MIDKVSGFQPISWASFSKGSSDLVIKSGGELFALPEVENSERAKSVQKTMDRQSVSRSVNHPAADFIGIVFDQYA